MGLLGKEVLSKLAVTSARTPFYLRWLADEPQNAQYNLIQFAHAKLLVCPWLLTDYREVTEKGDSLA